MVAGGGCAGVLFHVHPALASEVKPLVGGAHGDARLHLIWDDAGSGYNRHQLTCQLTLNNGGC